MKGLPEYYPRLHVPCPFGLSRGCFYPVVSEVSVWGSMVRGSAVQRCIERRMGESMPPVCRQAGRQRYEIPQIGCDDAWSSF